MEPASPLFCLKSHAERLIENVSHIAREAEAVALTRLLEQALWLFIVLFSFWDLSAFG